MQQEVNMTTAAVTGSDPKQSEDQSEPHAQTPYWMAYPMAVRQPYAVMPHYVPYHQYAPPPLRKALSPVKQMRSDNNENKTVWIGDLHRWMDESYLLSCFAPTGEVSSIKVIRNKHSGLSEGYGFVEFFSHSAAEKVIQGYLGMLMPYTDQSFRLNWATLSVGDKRPDSVPDLSIFVGDLAADVTDKLLLETFSEKYPSVKAVKVVFDANTGRSKGYGFVRFGEEQEKSQAMTEMNGAYCSSRPMRIGAATPRKSAAYQQQGSNGTSAHSDSDFTNTTIFVGGLDPSVTDDDLKQPFSECGEIVSIKIPVGKGCGFVQFSERKNAEDALQKLNGTVIGKQTVRLSWGRSPANKQLRYAFGYNNNSNGAYYSSPIYEGYGYPMAVPRNVHPAGYGPYPIYASHQQQVS